jgi:hypothetical protein
MKTSSANPGPPSAERTKAWSCLIANLVVLPGLGSVMAGRKAGYLQIVLAIGGFVVTLVALIKIVLFWAHDFQLPTNAGLYRTAIGGMAVFLVSWVWSRLTSLTAFRDKP